MWGLFLAALIAFASAQDYVDYYPSARSVNLRRLNQLANRVDKFIAVPRGFWDGSFQRNGQSQRALEVDDAIGVRGNFDDILTPGEPSAITLPAMNPNSAARRLPMSIMGDNELGPAMQPTQWQMMVAPFSLLLPDISTFCQCKGMANCGCCLGFYIKPLIGLRNNACLNVTLARDANSHSQYMIHTRLHIDALKIVDVSVSERQSPMVCVGLGSVAGCLQLTDVHRDPMEEKYCACVALSLQIRENPLLTLPNACLCLGKPVPESKKRGIFGLNLGGLFDTVTSMLG